MITTTDSEADSIYLCPDGHSCLIPSRERVPADVYQRACELLNQDIRSGALTATDATCSNFTPSV